MNVTLLQENLKTALTTVSKAVPSKPPLAILSSILLKTNGTALELSATDLYLGIRTQVLGSVEAEGQIAISGKTLTDLVNALPPGKITLETKDTTLYIKSENGKTQMAGQVSDDFPPFPQMVGETITLTLDQLEKIDARTRFSASLDPTRLVLTALLFQFSPDNLRVVGTDGFRLAVQEFSGQNFAPESKLLVPARAISEVTRIAQLTKQTEVTFTISQELKQLAFVLGETEVFIRLIDGDFPPYEKILPREFATTAIWDGEEFQSHLKRAMIFAREASHIIKFDLGEKTLTLTASASAQGEYQGQIPLKLTGPGGQIAFNARYVAEFMATQKPSQVWFGMNESLKPALFRPLEAPEFSYVVMPFRVNEA